VDGRVLALGRSRLLQTTAGDGDFGRDAPGTPARQEALTGQVWTTVHQVHGADVVVVDRPRGRLELDADGIVTAAQDVPIAMMGADCSLIAFASPEGVTGIAHAGWRGLAAGVVAAVAEQMRLLGATSIEAAVGPMIHAECYAFGGEDLDRVAGVLGAGVRSTTAAGELALDLPAGVARALDDAGVTRACTLGRCTACEGGWFSYRARAESERHALAIWWPSAPARLSWTEAQ
jgi:YfiH family protein